MFYRYKFGFPFQRFTFYISQFHLKEPNFERKNYKSIQNLEHVVKVFQLTSIFLSTKIFSLPSKFSFFFPEKDRVGSSKFSNFSYQKNISHERKYSLLKILWNKIQIKNSKKWFFSVWFFYLISEIIFWNKKAFPFRLAWFTTRNFRWNSLFLWTSKKSLDSSFYALKTQKKYREHFLLSFNHLST